jgi:hypothetical protein
LRLSIVIPTVPGREDELARTIAVYERLTAEPIEWIIERGHDNCGAAWNAGAMKATGYLLHMGADDLEPETAAWLSWAVATVKANGVPVGWVREGQGKFGRDFCRVPFCRREWWQPVPEVHYWSDNAFTELMCMAGHFPTVADGFNFYHRRSMVGRDESSERLRRDRTVCEQAMSSLRQRS